MKDLQIDESRSKHAGYTGIYVRAQGPDGKWDNYDIAQLDRDSLAEFSRSRGEVSDWGMAIIWHLLGHPRSVKEPDTPIYSLNLTSRAINCLERAGIDTVEKLCEKSWPELLDLRGFGQGSLGDVISELENRGLSLRGGHGHGEI